MDEFEFWPDPTTYPVLILQGQAVSILPSSLPSNSYFIDESTGNLSLFSQAAPVAEWVRSLNFSTLNHSIISPL